MLKFSRGKLIVFDIEEALSFEGETGPYLQYAVVRANNIFNKLQRARRRDARPTCSPALDRTPADELTAVRRCRRHDLWALVLEASRLDDIVEQVVRVARVLGAGQVRVRPGADCSTRSTTGTRSSTRSARSGSAGAPPGVAYVRAQLTRALDLMGIDVPARM